MKRLLLALALAAALTVPVVADSGLAVYYFVFDPATMPMLGTVLPPGGILLEVFVRSADPNTTSFKVTVQYTNKDGSFGIKQNQADRAADGDTVIGFSIDTLASITSIRVDEQRMTNSQLFQIAR